MGVFGAPKTPISSLIPIPGSIRSAVEPEGHALRGIFKRRTKDRRTAQWHPAQRRILFSYWGLYNHIRPYYEHNTIIALQ